ncbi:MAG: sigma-70 family RNA polymerase sigma factor [Acidobacteriota bacterium]
MQRHLVEQNLGFAIKLACEHRNLGLPLGDLVSEGSLGLIEAARRFDPARGVKFVTYAVAWVRKSILRALARHTRTIRIPSYQIDSFKRFQQVEATLATELGRWPMRDEVSCKLSTTSRRLETMLRRRITEVSLDSNDMPGLQHSLLRSVEDARAENPEQEFLKDENRLLIEEAMSALTERERWVIEARYRLRSETRPSLGELGVELGLCRERVRQIEQRAKGKMRRILARKLLCRCHAGAMISTAVQLRTACGPAALRTRPGRQAGLMKPECQNPRASTAGGVSKR